MHPPARQARLALAVAVLTLTLAAPARAAPPPQPVSPFDLIGFLQAATRSGTDSLAGGTLTVHGQVVTVPRNTIVLLPATALTWAELFTLAPPPYGPTQTGLALGDAPAPTTTWQVHVVGNRVGDQYIAGLITFAQDALATGQGFVNSIDYTSGELRVGGTIGDPTTGQRVRLNDPIGRFGRAASPDVRFTVDEDNPTVRAETGFPLCIPRGDPAAGDDPLCPPLNRPVDLAGRFVTTQTFLDPALRLGPDATRPAPIEVGDFVTYSGILVRDGASPTAGPFAGPASSYVSASSLVANLGFFTAPGTDPAYVAIDVTILGVGGVPIDGVPQEATVRTRFEGFTTDPSRVIELRGLDVDPCTGAVSERDWGSVAVDPGPPVGAVLGRWRFVPPTRLLTMPRGGVFLPATREVRAHLRLAAPVVTPIGLTAGQYRAPITEYLFPENLAVGGPPVPLNFQEFPFLAHGSGPWAGAGPSPVPAGIVGQLSPWPGSPAPTPISCGTSGQPPVASAGLAQSVPVGAAVQLDGSLSYDPAGLALSFAWTQLSGPAVVLTGAATARPAFTAPALPAGATSATLTFQLTVQDTAGGSAQASVAVTVAAAAGVKPPVASVVTPLHVASNARVTLNALASSDANLPPLPLSFAWTQVAGPAVVLTGATTATPTFTAPTSTTQQQLSFWLVVTSSAGLGATAQADVVVAPVVAPSALAGAAQAVQSGTKVTLDGSASFDPQGLPLTYSWKQVSGPAVTLVGATTAKPTFTAPAATSSLVFSLVVSNGFLSSAPSTVTVAVSRAPDTVIITNVLYRTAQQRYIVTAQSTVTDGTPVLTAKLSSGPSAVMTFAGAGTYTVTFTGVSALASVTVTSSRGGSATSGVTQVR